MMSRWREIRPTAPVSSSLTVDSPGDMGDMFTNTLPLAEFHSAAKLQYFTKHLAMIPFPTISPVMPQCGHIVHPDYVDGFILTIQFLGNGKSSNQPT